MPVNLDYARKAEGDIYGEGTTVLAERIANAAEGLKKATEQADAVHEALRTFAAEIGMNPDIECFLRVEGVGRNVSIRVSFEAGPYQWAIVASEALAQVGVFAEPYYSFDLCFYPAEDRA